MGELSNSIETQLGDAVGNFSWSGNIKKLIIQEREGNHPRTEMAISIDDK